MQDRELWLRCRHDSHEGHGQLVQPAYWLLGHASLHGQHDLQQARVSECSPFTPGAAGLTYELVCINTI